MGPGLWRSASGNGNMTALRAEENRHTPRKPARTIQDMRLASLLVRCIICTSILLYSSLASAQESGDPPADDTPQIKSATPEETEPAAKEEAPETAAPAPSPAPAKPSPWQPPNPALDGFDWIQLTSGEWLKGEVKIMQDEVLDFDSDELDDLSFDWSDIDVLRCPKDTTIAFDDDVTATGSVVMHDGIITVRGDDGSVVSRNRDRVFAVLPGDMTERNFWSGKLSFGYTARSGNTDQTDITGNASIRRRDADTRYLFQYSGILSEVDDDEIAKNHRIDTRFDVFLTRRLYVTVPSLSWVKDKFQNIDHRLTPGVLVGYHLVDKPKFDLEVAGGAGYQYTKFESTPAGEDDSDGTGAGLAKIELDWDITSTVELEGAYTLYLIMPDTEESQQNLSATLSVDLWRDLDLDVSFVWDRVGSPERGSDGERPDPDDVRVTVGFGWEF